MLMWMLSNWMLGLLTILALIWLSKQLGSKSSFLNLPPGPCGIPFLGYLPFLGRESHKTFAKLAKQHGGIFGLYLGNQYFVVLEDFNAVKEAYFKDDFLSRPDEYFQISPRYKHLIESSGSLWKDQRRFQLSTFKALGLEKKFMEFSILSEIKLLIETLESKVGGEQVDLNDLLERPFDHVIFYLLYGKKLDSKHSYVQNVPQFVKSLGSKYRWQEDFNFFPWLKTLLPIVYPSYKKVEAVIQNMADIVSEEVQIHKRNFDDDNPKDFVDYFLKHMSETSKSINGFCESSLVGNMLMLFSAGSITTRLTFTWFLMSMAENLNVQNKVYQEIIDYLGPDKEPENGDQVYLPYTCAAIAEAQRMNPITYLNLLRSCSTDGAKIGGFDVPKNSIIIQNQWSLNFNEDLWTSPDQFQPERFLNETGFKAPEYFIPFSCGKRRCPGSKLAGLSVFLFAVCLLRRFRFLPPDGGLSMDVTMTFNVEPAKPFLLLQLR